MSTKIVRRYDLPNASPGEGWAVITVHEDGIFQAVSDYGNYGYWWGSHGCRDFREFLCRRSYSCPDGEADYYFVSKLGRGDKYDGEATLKKIKRFIIEARTKAHRSGAFSKRPRNLLEWRGDPLAWTWDRARIEWGLLAEHSNLEHEHDYYLWNQATDIECYDNGFYTTSPSPQVLAFVTKVMPRLAKLLEAELLAEGYFDKENRK